MLWPCKLCGGKKKNEVGRQGHAGRGSIFIGKKNAISSSNWRRGRNPEGQETEERGDDSRRRNHIDLNKCSGTTQKARSLWGLKAIGRIL